MPSTVTIHLTGAVPSKKNSKQMVCRGRRPILLPYPTYTRWQKQVGEVFSPYAQWGRGVQEPLFIAISLFDKKNKDGTLPRRVFDLTNKAESILDTLVDYSVIRDDNYTVVNKVLLEFGGYRPEQGAVITITPTSALPLKMV